MDVSVVICTWNRASLLDGALRALAPAIARADGHVEVIVVDNGCTDHTADVVAAATAYLPVRLIVERRPGLSSARNAAVLAARGRHIAWIDDDVRVDPHWLVAYQRAIAADPGASFFGGPVVPVLQGTPPAWLSQALPEIADVFAAVDHGDTSFVITENRHLPYGANYVVRTDVQRGITYDPALGRQPGHYWLAGEETQVLQTILVRGGRGRWVPDARVRHLIPPERQTLRCLVAQGFGSGRTDARLRPQRYPQRHDPRQARVGLAPLYSDARRHVEPLSGAGQQSRPIVMISVPRALHAASRVKKSAGVMLVQEHVRMTLLTQMG